MNPLAVLTAIPVSLSLGLASLTGIISPSDTTTTDVPHTITATDSHEWVKSAQEVAAILHSSPDADTTSTPDPTTPKPVKVKHLNTTTAPAPKGTTDTTASTTEREATQEAAQSPTTTADKATALTVKSVQVKETAPERVESTPTDTAEVKATTASTADKASAPTVKVKVAAKVEAPESPTALTKASTEQETTQAPVKEEEAPVKAADAPVKATTAARVAVAPEAPEAPEQATQDEQGQVEAEDAVEMTDEEVLNAVLAGNSPDYGEAGTSVWMPNGHSYQLINSTGQTYFGAPMEWKEMTGPIADASSIETRIHSTGYQLINSTDGADPANAGRIGGNYYGDIVLSKYNGIAYLYGNATNTPEGTIVSYQNAYLQVQDGVWTLMR